MKLYVDIVPGQVEHGHPLCETMSMDSHFKIKNFNSDEIIVTSLFGDPDSSSLCGGNPMQYFHILDSNILDASPKLVTCSAVYGAGVLRVMSGFYSSRRVIDNSRVSLWGLDYDFFVNGFDFSFLHARDEQSKSFVSARINCIEYYPNKVQLMSVVRVPLFCLDSPGSRDYREISLLRRQVIDERNKLLNSSGEMSSVIALLSDYPFTAQLWLRFVAFSSGNFELHCQVRHPMLNRIESNRSSEWFDAHSRLFGSSTNVPINISFS